MIVNIIILKDPEDIFIHCLSVINLYEQNYNVLVSLKWHQLIHFMLEHKIINESQYGGVPGIDLIVPTIIEEL